MDNKIYNIGDTLVVTVAPKQHGTTTLTGYEDELTGVTSERSVLREFRITEDTIFYADWEPLTQDAIRGRTLKQNNNIQVRYTRTGGDGEGEVQFVSIRFTGTFVAEVVNSPILDKSVFANIAWDEETELLCRNLFKKMYFRGIVPRYILRGDNVSAKEDRDYIDLFWTIARFFALMIRFFKRFENFFNDYDLMLEWLRQNGIYFDESTITLEEMQYLATHLLDEVRRRGTRMIFNYAGDETNGVLNEIDGEFIRLIRGLKSTELLYETIPLYKLGWVIGQSSPMWRGTSFAFRLNKTRETSPGFTSLDNFVTFTSGFGTLEIVDDDNRKGCLLLNSPVTSSCGLGRKDGRTDIDVSEKMYVADPKLDYEITFSMKILEAAASAKLYFGCEAFDSLKNKTNAPFITSTATETTEWFLDGMDLDKLVTDKWYFIRGILHSYSSDRVEEGRLNIGRGHNLVFNNSFIRYILPKIYIASDSAASVLLWGYKIRPLVRGTNILPLRSGYENSHSLGFIQCPKIFYAYFRNNNNSQSEAEITDIIERYLLPFNLTDILQFIGSES